MTDIQPFGSSVEMDAIRYSHHGDLQKVSVTVATEVPFTILVNGREIATQACSPIDLREFVYGFLFTAGVVQGRGDIIKLVVDDARWCVDVTIKREVDLDLLGKRIYTSGCGRGVMFSSVVGMASRKPLQDDFSVPPDLIGRSMKWLQNRSDLHRVSSGVHTAGVSLHRHDPEISYDDIGRHNAVDKVIGHLLLRDLDTSEAMLLLTGRISSEILYKAKRAGIPIVLSRSASTHQTILLGRDMGITVIGFARAGGFTVYSHEHRIRPSAMATSTLSFV